MSNKIIAVDFDGTIVTHMYPELGRPVPNAIRVLKALLVADCKLILWTMRSGSELQAAVDYCSEHDIGFWGINQNPDQISWTSSQKAYAHLYIDDAALGTPLLQDTQSGRSMVNWLQVEGLLKRLQVLI